MVFICKLFIRFVNILNIEIINGFVIYCVLFIRLIILYIHFYIFEGIIRNGFGYVIYL